MRADHDATDFRILVLVGALGGWRLLLGLSLSLGFQSRFVGGRKQDGRNKVPETFTHAGAGFDNQMLAVCQGSRDRMSHLKLLSTQFVIGDPPGDAPPGA